MNKELTDAQKARRAKERRETAAIVLLAIVVVAIILALCGGLIYVPPAALYALIDALFGTEIPVNAWTVIGGWVAFFIFASIIGALANIGRSSHTHIHGEKGKDAKVATEDDAEDYKTLYDEGED